MNRYRMHRNLNKKCWSVSRREPGLGWRVSEHVFQLVAFDVSFHVSEAGRMRVLRDKRKNVHAFATSDYYMVGNAPIPESWLEVRYDPYQFGHFFDSDQIPVESSPVVIFADNGRLYIPKLPI